MPIEPDIVLLRRSFAAAVCLSLFGMVGFCVTESQSQIELSMGFVAVALVG